MKFEDSNFFIKDPKILSMGRLGIGLLFLMGAFFDFFFPNPTSLSTGRWSWLYRGITEIFGPYSYVIFQTIIGLAFIAWSRSKPSKT
jgi:hypothetical protein